MKLYLKQHVFTWGDRFTVYDENGNDKYYVEGEIFTLGKKLHLFDTLNNESAFIKQQILTFLPHYFIYIDGIERFEVVKEFTLFKQEYSVLNRASGPDWQVEGDFFSHEYNITCDNRLIASVSKQWFTFGDAYELYIIDGRDEIPALAVSTVIDACLAPENN